jgi:hypothetical protein
MKVIAECKEDILRGDLRILNERIIALLHVQTSRITAPLGVFRSGRKKAKKVV